MAKQPKIQEAEVVGLLVKNFFKAKRFDCSRALGKIDFTVRDEAFEGDRTQGYYLWAESKGDRSDLLETLTQVVMTIGKERTYNHYNPPHFLGGFDNENILFVPYLKMVDIFSLNDFNWKVAPSDHTTKEFQLIYNRIKQIIEGNNEWQGYCFNYVRDKKDLERFIKENFVLDKVGTTKIQIDKNNFMIVYNKWLETVKPTIRINWDEAKKVQIIDGDFYLADLLSSENKTLKEKLFVILQIDRYRLARQLDSLGLESGKTAEFADGQKAHARFWAKYERPPAKQYWDYIIERRDLLVPQDIRERKGSFFTPQKWVELSQKYIADALGDSWQDEYYVWDCAAGTGNLLAGLTNKYNIWASTVDQADVDAMNDRIHNGANLLESHVFRFDFLNDDFKDLPKALRSIIEDPEKRKKLIVYINPPYTEESNVKTRKKTGTAKTGVHITRMHQKYTKRLGESGRELFIQFLARIYDELPGCRIAEFSTLKGLQAPQYDTFRNFFQAKLNSMFIVPADTFDNVNGDFPIGFKIWDTSISSVFSSFTADVFGSNREMLGQKTLYGLNRSKNINKWISLFKIVPEKQQNDVRTKEQVEMDFIKQKHIIGYMQGIRSNDFQNNNILYITNKRKSQLPSPRGVWINKDNLIPVAIYFAVRKCILATWLNDRDQFLAPNDGWQKDVEFQNNCLAYTIFNNVVQHQIGPNHWIPFRETEVGAKDKFASSFMADFIAGKIGHSDGEVAWTIEPETRQDDSPLEFSTEARTVLDAGRELWRYYHSMLMANPNASLYDIREHFKGRNEKGRLNTKSRDDKFNALDAALRAALKTLAKKIEPKVYEYGFLLN